MRGPLIVAVLGLCLPALASEPDAFNVNVGDFLKTSDKNSVPTVIGKPAGAVKIPARRTLLRLFIKKRAAKIPGAPERTEPLIVVSGFEPFGAFKINPSGEVARSLDGDKIGGCRVEGVTLPVEYQAADSQIETLMAEKKPDVFIMFGQMPAGSFRVETKAYNDAEEPDSKGACPADGGSVDAEGAETYSADPAVVRFIEELSKEGVPISVSDDPGRFLCNASYYTALQAAEKAGGRTTVVFVHIPLAEEALTAEQRRWLPSAPLRRIKRWARRAVKAAAETLREDAGSR